jgi:hypothetical protein
VLVIGLHTEIPPTVAALCELAVAAMLVGLGVSLLATLARGGRLHAHVHAHAGHAHGHPHAHAPGTDVHDHGPSARRPFLVGLVHGLAGSGALMLAVLASIPGPPLAFCYVAVFGLGSVGGMIVMSTLFAVPALVTTGRVARADVALRALAAAGSIAIGLHLAWEIGMEVGLLA